jgi:hypothetical protein
MGDEYLLDLLTNLDNELLGKVDDRKIYNEAKRVYLIDDEFKKVLHALYNERNTLIHSLFHPKKPANIATKETELALNYLKATMKCMEIVFGKVKEIQDEIKKIRAAGQIQSN